MVEGPAQGAVATCSRPSTSQGSPSPTSPAVPQHQPNCYEHAIFSYLPHSKVRSVLARKRLGWQQLPTTENKIIHVTVPSDSLLPDLLDTLDRGVQHYCLLGLHAAAAVASPWVRSFGRPFPFLLLLLLLLTLHVTFDSRSIAHTSGGGAGHVSGTQWGGAATTTGNCDPTAPVLQHTTM